MHEIAHLEWVPPHTKSMTQYMDFTQDGSTTITDLNAMRSFVLFNRDRYWNPKLKQEFLGNLSGLWDASYYEEGVMKEDLHSQKLEAALANADRDAQARFSRPAFPS